MGHFPLASQFPITDTQAFLGYLPWLQGVRFNFSTPGKFLLGHNERGGGMGHCLRHESATLLRSAPSGVQGRSLKAAPLLVGWLAGRLALFSLCTSREPHLHPALWTLLRPCRCGFCLCFWWAPLAVLLQHPPKVSDQDPSYPFSPAAQGLAYLLVCPRSLPPPREDVHRNFC